jgi:dihydroorotate dehydrogenase (NAD+) catalytic subunit
MDLSVNLAGLKLTAPTLTSSGTCGYALEYAPYLDFARLGAFVTKSITLEERQGNAPTRVVETRAGMLNAIGLANVGLARFLDEKVPQLRTMKCPVVVNVAGHSTHDYVETVSKVSPVDCVAAIELNVSCPNVSDGLTFGTNPARLRELIKEIKPVCAKKPLIVKLSPNVEDIAATARGAIEGGADILSLINTISAMSIDLKLKKPRLANVTGGLSGPAVKPVALAMVHKVYRQVAQEAGVPLIGMGGVQTWQDAAEFMLAGASAVSIGTALFVDPSCPQKIAEGLANYAQSQGFNSISELVGKLEV